MDVKLPHDEKKDTPLASLSIRFSETHMRWSVLEKEGYAVLARTTRLHWLTVTPRGFDLFTNHSNLSFSFHPLSFMPDFSESNVRKVLRWAIRLSTYNYVCFHIHSEDNA